MGRGGNKTLARTIRIDIFYLATWIPYQQLTLRVTTAFVRRMFNVAPTRLDAMLAQMCSSVSFEYVRRGRNRHGKRWWQCATRREVNPNIYCRLRCFRNHLHAQSCLRHEAPKGICISSRSLHSSPSSLIRGVHLSLQLLHYDTLPLFDGMALLKLRSTLDSL